jgi:tetratricopeptide (TPR) repeat protein
MDRLADTVLLNYVETSRKRGSKEDFNRLGVAYARFRRFQPALEALKRALRIDAGYVAAQVNLANVYFMQENYREAAARYQTTYDRLQESGKTGTALSQKVLLNLSAAHHQLGNYGEAEKMVALARGADPQGDGAPAYVAQADGSGGARAAEQVSVSILFVEEEE